MACIKEKAGLLFTHLAVAKEQVLTNEQIGSANVMIVEKKPSRDLSLLGHLTLMFAYFGSLAVLVAFTIYFFATSPDAHSQSLEFASAYGPFPVQINIQCITPPCGTVLITTNYSTDDPCGSANVQNGQSIVLPQQSPSQYMTVNLCPTTTGEQLTISQPIPLATRGVIIEFEGFDTLALAEVTVRAPPQQSLPSSVDAIRLDRTLNVFENDVKTLNLGVLVDQLDGKTQDVTLYENTFQLEGARVDNRTDLVLRVMPIATVRKTFSTRTIGYLVGGVGSAKEMVQLAFLVLIPVWFAYFRRSGGDQRRSAGSPTSTTVMVIPRDDGTNGSDPATSTAAAVPIKKSVILVSRTPPNGNHSPPLELTSIHSAGSDNPRQKQQLLEAENPHVLHHQRPPTEQPQRSISRSSSSSDEGERANRDGETSNEPVFAVHQRSQQQQQHNFSSSNNSRNALREAPSEPTSTTTAPDSGLQSVGELEPVFPTTVTVPKTRHNASGVRVKQVLR